MRKEPFDWTRGCGRFSFMPDPDPECCELCHGGEAGHGMYDVMDHGREKIESVCHPVAERLQAMGYLFDGALPHDSQDLEVDVEAVDGSS